MRRVRGGPVGGESETGHGRGQTITRSIEVVLDEEGQRWASWGRVRDGTWTGSDHNEEYRS